MIVLDSDYVVQESTMSPAQDPAETIVRSERTERIETGGAKRAQDHGASVERGCVALFGQWATVSFLPKRRVGVEFGRAEVGDVEQGQNAESISTTITNAKGQER